MQHARLTSINYADYLAYEQRSGDKMVNTLSGDEVLELNSLVIALPLAEVYAEVTVRGNNR